MYVTLNRILKQDLKKFLKGKNKIIIRLDYKDQIIIIKIRLVSNERMTAYLFSLR